MVLGLLWDWQTPKRSGKRKTRMNINDAARRLVQGFQAIPQTYISAAIESGKIETPIGEPYCAMPMWGTLFLVSDSVDARKIREMCTPINPDLDDMEREELESLAQDWGVTPDLPDADEDGEEDETALEELRDAIRETIDDDELGMLGSYGWEQVGSTGILAIELDDELFLGIHGAGYCFYSSHWEPLYRALGYQWHDEEDASE